MTLEQLIRYRNERSPFTRRLGIELEALRPGYARVRKTIEPEDANSLDRTHGGVYFTLADSACGSAASAHGYKAVTVDANYHFYRSAVPGDILTAEAVEAKYGKTICVYDVQVRDQNGTLLGGGTFTFYRLSEKLELDSPSGESSGAAEGEGIGVGQK